MLYFKDCKSIEEAKKLYRELLKKHHPDHSGPDGEAITKEIINQFNSFLKAFMSNSFNSYYKDKEYKPKEENITPFQEILQKVINLDCEIEIIGYWVYCFKSKEVREKLKELGFWYSSTHLAWIFSGKLKKRVSSRYTLDEIRANKGSQKVQKENAKETTLKIAM